MVQDSSLASIAPLVSIVMATHNGQRHLVEALESIFKQTYDNWELIIIDDASTDGTGELVNKFNSSKIRVVRNDTQLGLTRSLNKGIRAAKGEIIARIDDDDVWTDPNKLTKQVEFLQAHPAVGVCGTQYVVIKDNGEQMLRLQYPCADADLRQKILAANPFVHSGVCIRRQILDRVGVYDESLQYAQDYELWLRLGRTAQLANLPEYCVAKRFGATRISSRRALQQYVSFVRTAAKYRHVHPGFYRNLPIYIREFLINLLMPKTTFYQLSAAKRAALAWSRTHLAKFGGG